MKDKILLLVNTGTPLTAQKRDVRRYLSQFLNDRRVITLPWLARKILVNLIIVPFRAGKSAKLYRQIWTDQGSPLLLNLEKLVSRVEREAGEKWKVRGVMRYGEPSLRKTLMEMKSNPPEEIVIMPLYPHYASSTTGSVIEDVLSEVCGWNVIPAVRFTGQFYNHPGYLDAMAGRIMEYDLTGFDHVIFSYHGLPSGHIRKIHPGADLELCSCTEEMPEHGVFCYRATCFATTRLLAERLSLGKDRYSTTFQSRLSSDWIKPFTEDRLTELAGRGHRRVLVVAPSFVSDCLETIDEIDHHYHAVFKSAGGEQLVTVRSLNDSETWVKAVIDITGVGE